MPTLNNQGELIDSIWFVAEAAEQDGQAGALVAQDRWQPNAHQGLLLASDAEPHADFTAAEMIAIHFPTFNDGRGLSLAVLLRERFDFSGELRAIGDVHPDMLHYLRRSGFDSFELPPERDIETAQAALKPYSAYYQASVAEPVPIYRR